MKTDDIVIDGCMFGDNCFNLLVEIGEHKDILVPMTYFLNFREVLTKPFRIKIGNDNSIVDTTHELMLKMHEFVDMLYSDYEEVY